MSYPKASKSSSKSKFYAGRYGRISLDFIKEDYREEEEKQGGYRAGRSCTDNVFTLKQVIEKR